MVDPVEDPAPAPMSIDIKWKCEGRRFDSLHFLRMAGRVREYLPRCYLVSVSGCVGPDRGIEMPYQCRDRER